MTTILLAALILIGLNIALVLALWRLDRRRADFTPLGRTRVGIDGRKR